MNNVKNIGLTEGGPHALKNLGGKKGRSWRFVEYHICIHINATFSSSYFVILKKVKR